MSALDLLLLAAVTLGIGVQAAIGFGFAFFVAPAAFAALPPERAVTLVALLAVAISCLVLFGEHRRVEVARRPVALIVAAAIPGMLVGAWIVTHADRSALQLAVGVVVIGAAALQALGGPHPSSAPARRPALELGGGFAAGALTTSVSVNGPAVVLVLTRLGLRGSALRDTLAAALLGLSGLAAPLLVLGAGAADALPELWLALACVPTVLIGHRVGAAAFRRLDAESHHRLALAAAGVAGVLSVVAGLSG